MTMDKFCYTEEIWQKNISEHERKARIGWKFSLYQGKKIWKSYKWTQNCPNETNVDEQREQLKKLLAKIT